MSNNNSSFIKELLLKRENLISQLEAINVLIESMGIDIPESNASQSPQEKQREDIPVYDSSKSIKYKVMFVMKLLNRFLHSTEIRKKIAELDGLQDYKSVNVSPTLSQLKHSKIIDKYQVDNQNRNTFWGSVNWLDDNGNIKPEYAYNSDLLVEGDKTNEIKL